MLSNLFCGMPNLSGKPIGVKIFFPCGPDFLLTLTFLQAGASHNRESLLKQSRAAVFYPASAGVTQPAMPVGEQVIYINKKPDRKTDRVLK